MEAGEKLMWHPLSAALEPAHAASQPSEPLHEGKQRRWGMGAKRRCGISCCLPHLPLILLPPNRRSTAMCCGHHASFPHAQLLIREPPSPLSKVHGDVFRPPRYLELLAALVGTGVQLALLMLSVIAITIAGGWVLLGAARWARRCVLAGCCGSVAGRGCPSLSSPSRVDAELRLLLRQRVAVSILLWRPG